jgi:hypothetical protein
VFARVATTLLLCFQLTVLVVGTLPERDACCCVAKGKPCECKSHAPKHASDERPCFAADCASSQPVAFPVVVWLSVPDRSSTPVCTPTATLTWPLPTAGPERATRPEAPPPRAG